MNELNLAEKKKLVPKGKKLNHIKIKHRAEEVLGPNFRGVLRERINCSSALITMALGGKAPYALFEINRIVKEAEAN